MEHDFKAPEGSSYQPLGDVDRFLSDLKRQQSPQPQQEQPKEYRQVSDPELDAYLKDIEKGMSEADIEQAQQVTDGAAEVVQSKSRSRLVVKPKARYNIVGDKKGTVESNPQHSGQSMKLDPEPRYDALNPPPPGYRPPQSKRNLKKLKRLN